LTPQFRKDCGVSVWAQARQTFRFSGLHLTAGQIVYCPPINSNGVKVVAR